MGEPGMSSWEFVYWVAYHTIEPFGVERDDLRMAIHASANVNCHISKGERSKPDDFMPKFAAPLTDEQQRVNKGGFRALKAQQEAAKNNKQEKKKRVTPK